MTFSDAIKEFELDRMVFVPDKAFRLMRLFAFVDAAAELNAV